MDPKLESERSCQYGIDTETGLQKLARFIM
jgi:hypothetical protein